VSQKLTVKTTAKNAFVYCGGYIKTIEVPKKRREGGFALQTFGL